MWSLRPGFIFFTFSKDIYISLQLTFAPSFPRLFLSHSYDSSSWSICVNKLHPLKVGLLDFVPVNTFRAYLHVYAQARLILKHSL